MTWQSFLFFAISAALLWIAGATLALRRPDYSRWAAGLTGAGLLVYTVFIVGLWIGLQRPPLRTMGETRLWYSFFLILAGLLTYRRWHYGWLLLCSTVIALVFVLINLLKPEIHDQSLMPALQSFWFIPHVTVYIFAYAVLGCAFLLALAGWRQKTERFDSAKRAMPSLLEHGRGAKTCLEKERFDSAKRAVENSFSDGRGAKTCLEKDRYFPTIDRLVYIGTAFLTLGMLSGMLWAKAAWGHFWGWDPKETWAAITWCVYLIYIHLRLYGRGSRTLLNCLLTIGFICMQMCWYGVNYLPAAKASLHVYG